MKDKDDDPIADVASTFLREAARFEASKKGTFDVTYIRSTADTFEIGIGDFVPDDDRDTAAKLSDILREHGAFSEGLLSELVKFVEAEREDERFATMEDRDLNCEYD